MLRFAFLFFALGSSFTWADTLKFGSVELDAIEQNIWQVQFRYSDKNDALSSTSLSIDPTCTQLSPQYKQSWQSGKSLQWTITCPISQPQPAWLEVIGLTDPAAQIYFHLTDHTGLQRNKLSTHGNFRWIPDTIFNEKKDLPVLNYLPTGIKHIFSGADHLSLIILMLFMVTGKNKNMKRLFQIITAFTVGHSVTLGLASFNLISIHPKSVELMISLSIVILAAELIRSSSERYSNNLNINQGNNQSKNQSKHIHPAILTFTFGLIHGLGFSSVLQTIGLPDDNKLLALFFFNSGVEIGQVFFILTILTIINLSKRTQILGKTVPFKKYTQLVPLYCIGALGVTWSVLRLT